MKLKRVFLILSTYSGLHCYAQVSTSLFEEPLLLSDAEAESSAALNEKKQAHVFDPNAMPNSHGLWIDGDLLFWKSNVGSLEYGIKSNSTALIKDGHVNRPHFEWNWGFRLGMGFKLPHDKWDTVLNYTHLDGKAHGFAGGTKDTVFPTWATALGFSSGNFYANKAKAHWKINLNMADVELGRHCFAGKWLTIRPFVGVRGLVIDQDYTVKYAGGTVAPADVDKVALDTDFWGVGIRLGFNTLWGLGKGFAIYGNGSASLLSGNFKVHEVEKLESTGVRRLDIKNHLDPVATTTDLAMGLQWDYLFSKDRFHFGVKFGWEFNMFFDQNQLFNFLSSTSPGIASFKEDDLSFQGMTMGLRFDF